MNAKKVKFGKFAQISWSKLLGGKTGCFTNYYFMSDNVTYTLSLQICV